VTTPALTVAVLAYNEEANVRAVVHEITDELSRLDAEWEVLLVDDGSTDGTGRVADELAREHPCIRVVHHAQNQGLGAGYRTGFDQARGTFMIFFPADGQFPPRIITSFFRQMADLDMLLGYLPNRQRPPLARAASFAEQILYRLLIGKMPRFQGVLMFRTALLRDILLVSTGRGWAIILELIIRVSRGHYRVRSTPTPLRSRMSGESKVMDARTIQANLRQLLDLRRALRVATGAPAASKRRLRPRPPRWRW
jgi:glycosyltransferase involved in cell wall biosynthesis